MVYNINSKITQFKKGNDMWTRRKNNIPWNKGKKGLQVAWNKGIRKELDLDYIKKSYLEDKKSTRRIAKELNVSKSYINKRLREMNINLRDNSEITKWNKGKKTGQIPWNKNISWSEKIKDKISKTKKQYLLENPEEKLRLKQLRAKQIFPKKDSKIEIKIQNFLEELGIDYIKHKYMNIKHSYQCDIFIPSLNLVIECDGNYWHKYPTRRDIDNIRTSELVKNGFKVLRLWEVDIIPMNLNDFKELL